MTEGGDRQEAGEPGSEAPAQPPRSGRRLADTARRLDRSPKTVRAARRLRKLLPGDSRFGDPLSTAGDDSAALVGRRLSELAAERPGALREAGLAAAQVWQALSEAQGRGRGHAPLTIVFTDLADFSSWALEAGDTLVLDLLRDVSEAVEPPITERDGRVVKRMGDGLMAVFIDPAPALEAVFDARDRVAGIEREGYRARLRAGIHVGRPRKIGGDYLGVDVNVAARLMEHAKSEEIVVSDAALDLVDTDELKVRRRRLRAKGTPKELTTYAVDRAH
jgi:adenylate cyclase